MNKNDIIQDIFDTFQEVRYVAIYHDQDLFFKQKDNASNTSSENSDTYEELLVNPTLLKLASQRGNIDCGGLSYLIIAYGNFFQLVRSIPNGHISICLEKSSDLSILPKKIISFIENTYPQLANKS